MSFAEVGTRKPNVDKTVNNSKSLANLRPFKPGPDPKRGRGPAKGAPNAGRPPDAFKALCQGIADQGAMALLAKRVLSNPKHPAFQFALKWATDHGYGKAMQPMELTGKDGAPLLAQSITFGDRTIEF